VISSSPVEEEDPMYLLALVLSLTPSAAEWPTRGWTASTPEAEDVDGSVLEAFHRDLASGRHGYVDSMLVIRNGRIVFERSYTHDYNRLFEGKGEPGMYNYYDPDWHPYYRRGSLHTMQSVSKSVTSALIGIARENGASLELDAPVLSLFQGFRTRADDLRWKNVTLRNLLTMTSGIDWDETTVDYTDPKNTCAAMEASENWVQFVLDRNMAAEPGEVFVYNSGVTELLGQILKQATGKDPDAYAAEHLFPPLGIENWYWKKTSTGLSDTEGGLYLTGRDLAKIGYLYLKDGVWEGKRILPEGWVEASSAPAVSASTNPARERKYGFQWWLLPYEGSKRAWAQSALGYGGQFLFVVPEYDLIAVFTGWNIYGGPSLEAPVALQKVVDSVR
jgi:CubicO group peptidase (beta-lactamase class C family)